jgi:hypothetical protein
MSAMAEMSRAIRLTIEKWAPAAGPQKGMLQGLDQEVLDDFAEIVAAFSGDLSGERMRRQQAAHGEDAPPDGEKVA